MRHGDKPGVKGLYKDLVTFFFQSRVDPRNWRDLSLRVFSEVGEGKVTRPR